MKTKNEYREHLADIFIKAIEEDGLNWKKGWIGLEAPKSAITNAAYKGVNRFILTMESLVNGYEDPRWCTFKQIQDKGWQLEKGSKGTQIEFWVPLHPDTNKTISWDEANRLKRNDPDIQIKAVPQYYYVFNAEKIKGIPERELRANLDIKVEEIVPKISQNMGVEILNDTTDRAYYSTREDKVHLPKPEQFLSSYDYHATAMHELAHASGAAHRLNRDLSGRFGTPSYAFEELVAEMSATFMSEHLPYELSGEHLESHKAYVQSWMSAIKDNPDYLIQAIKKADACATYLEEQAEISKQLEIERTISKEAQLTEGHEELYTKMQALGFELENLNEQTEDNLLHFKSADSTLELDSWDKADEFINDVYNAVSNFSEEDLQSRQAGNYDIIEHDAMNNDVVNAALKNYDKLHAAMLYDLTSGTDSPGMEGIYMLLYKNEMLKDMETIMDMKSLGFELDFKELEKGNLSFVNSAGQSFNAQNMDNVYEVVLDIYNAANKHTPEQITNFLSGAEPFPTKYQSSLDKAILFSTVLENQDALMDAKSISRSNGEQGWKEVYVSKYFENALEAAPKYLENVKQIDRAKGDIHIYQDKNNAKHNYIGKKVEQNGIKKIQKLSDKMDLKSAQDKLKESIKLSQPDKALQIKQQKSIPLTIGRGQ